MVKLNKLDFRLKHIYSSSAVPFCMSLLICARGPPYSKLIVRGPVLLCGQLLYLLIKFFR